MFDEHQAKIGRYARRDADSMARVYAFVLMTVQQPLHMMPTAMRSLDTDGVESRFLWGFKIPAYDFLMENKQAIYDVSMAIYRGHADPELQQHELLRYFAGLPGLGVVKGGFMVQLCFGLAGCIDSHNMARFGIKPSRFKAARFKRAQTKTRNVILRDYFSVIKTNGGCAELWNSWCVYVHKRNPVEYTSAYAVSELHVTAIGADNEIH